jgi:hypothetical protein
MGERRKSTKRPCRICGKWFTQHPRLGTRQKTCGKESCMGKWHAKKCAEWNKKNRSYFQAIYLGSKLESVKSPSQSENRPPPCLNPDKTGAIRPPSSRSIPQLPGDVIQDVIGVQPLIIIEYVSQLLIRSFKEVIRAQPFEMQREIDQLPCERCLRSDRLGQGP